MEFFVELEGYLENNDIKFVRDDVIGYWWILSDYFLWDMFICYFE